MQVANTRYFFFDAYLRSRVHFRSSIRAHFFVDGVGHTVGRRTPMGRICRTGKLRPCRSRVPVPKSLCAVADGNRGARM